jgi:dTDP-4-dehydrorhamnose reductase
VKILLIGSTGQLGSDLIRNNPGHEMITPSRAQLDLARSPEILQHVAATKPDVVINCAAFHNVPNCEEQPAQAFLVNCVAVRDLAMACESIGAWFINFSTDYVFDGQKHSPYIEEDCPCPLQIYGISRLAGERAAFANAPRRTIVIRTCGLYGASGARSKGGNFVDGRIMDADKGRRIEMACEQIVAPTSTDDLSHAVFQLLNQRELHSGILHLVNEGSCSWYEFTVEIVRIYGKPCDVVPVDRGGLTGTMRRPKYSVLGSTKARDLGITLRPWRDALRAYIHKKYASL